jgi:hypothetical protein
MIRTTAGGGDLCQVKPATQDACLVILALILQQLLELRVLPRVKRRKPNDEEV